MTEEKRRELERLSADAHDKRLQCERLWLMNMPNEPEARKAADIEYMLARREMIEARRALEDAINA